ncbi:MAG: alpha/beta hydrolase fold domain-containing protein [Alphaproteobacteria bacterium]|nr:alpha/beta hydrolase fold domain-containing protein [Alphaproteobacteria bacterium]
MTDLDPKIRQLLDLMASIEQPPFREQSIAEFRERRAIGRDMLILPSPELDVVRDFEVAGAEHPLKARIYDVEDGDARPTLAYFHGGGFVFGDLESHDSVCRRLAAAGEMRVISVDYRLAPEAPFPAAIEDAVAAVADIAERASDFGADPARLAVGGDSAGACLATLAARQFARAPGPQISFQLLIYPVVQMGEETASRRNFAEGYFLTRDMMEWFYELYMPDGGDFSSERVSPLRHDPPEGLAPAYVVTAGFDPLRDEGRAYAEKLRSAGVAVEHVNYPDQIHGFFNFTAFSSAAAGAIERAGKAVRLALG